MEGDQALLSRLRAGDEEAFAALVARHDGALRRVARTHRARARVRTALLPLMEVSG